MSPIEARNDGNSWLLTSFSTKSGGISAILIGASSYAEASLRQVLVLGVACPLTDSRPEHHDDQKRDVQVHDP